jgi:hypothetical protein
MTDSIPRRLAVPLLVLALAGLACGVASDPNDRLMTDDELIAVFKQERASFDSLAVMFDDDRAITMLDGYAVRHADDIGVSPERWDTYARLLLRIHVGRNVWSDDDGVLYQQYVNKFGDENGRWMRGYYYARKPLAEPRRIWSGDLLSAPDMKYPPNTHYRHLDGPWYLYSDHGYTD